MSRKRKAAVRIITPDPKYGNVTVAKFINSIMLDGKKNVAEKIFYDAMDMLKNKGKQANELETFLECVEKVKPSLEVKSRRVGGATYQVPMDVRPARKETLAIRWMTAATRKRSENTMAERLFKELMDIMNDSGNSVKKRQDTHKMAEANKAFSHFKW